MKKFCQSFKGFEDPRTSDAPRFSRDADDRGVFEPVRRADLRRHTDYAECNEAFLRHFMRLEHGSPSHDAFSQLFQMIELAPFAPGSGIVLGQMVVDTKSNEIRALSAPLKMLELEGTIIAAEAMHTQRTASELIIGKGEDCVRRA